MVTRLLSFSSASARCPSGVAGSESFEIEASRSKAGDAGVWLLRRRIRSDRRGAEMRVAVPDLEEDTP